MRVNKHVSMRPLGHPEKVAAALCHLVLADASLVTGSALNAAGSQEVH